MVPTIQDQRFLQIPCVPESTLGLGRLGPLSLVVPPYTHTPSVKLKDADERRGASYRFLYLQRWGCLMPIGFRLQGQNELTAPQGTATSSSLLCEQLGPRSVFSRQQLSIAKRFFFPLLLQFFSPLAQILFFFFWLILMHIKAFVLR